MTFWHIALKDVRLQIKDLPNLLFLFLTPLLVIAVAGFALPSIAGKSYSKFEIPVVQQDQGPVAQAIVSELKKVSSIDSLTTYTTASGQKQAMTLDEAKSLLPNDKAVIIIPAHFSSQVMQKRPATLTVLADPTDQIVHATVNSIVAGIANQVVGSPQLISVRQDTGQLGSNYHQPSPFDGTVPGYAVMFILFSTMFAAASLLVEREAGTLRKLKTLPISKFSVIAGKMLANFLVALLQSVVLFTAGHFLFNMWLGHDLLALIVTIVLTSFAATGLGMLIASFITTRAQATGVVTLCVLAMSALGGSWWPLYIEPGWMQQIAKGTLTAWSMSGFNQLLVYGKGFESIITPLIVLAGIGVGGILIATHRFRYE